MAPGHGGHGSGHGTAYSFHSAGHSDHGHGERQAGPDSAAAQGSGFHEAEDERDKFSVTSGDIPGCLPGFLCYIKKGLSFISNSQRRNEGTFSASELAGIEPTPPAPKGTGYVRLDHSATVLIAENDRMVV
jgi:hypothetical protein